MKIAASYAAYAEYDPTHFVAGRYNSRISQLESHQHVIELFRTALEDAGRNGLFFRLRLSSSSCFLGHPENLKRKTKTAWNFAGVGEALSKEAGAGAVGSTFALGHDEFEGRKRERVS